MKSHSILMFLLFVAFGCTNSKSNQEALSDSTKQVVDSVLTDDTQTQYEESYNSEDVPDNEPFSGTTLNFPEYSMTTLSNDSVEAEITNRITELIQVYDTMQFSKITSSYSWERPFYALAQDGPGSMSVENEEEIKTWFFDRSNQLRAFSKEIKTENNGTNTLSTLYLFSNDSLIAINEHVNEGSDAGVYIGQMRIMASICPHCGLSVSTFEGILNGEVKYLSEKDLEAKQQEFYESMPELIQILKAGRKNAKEDDADFIFSVNRTKEGESENKTKTITYPVEFRVTKDLYPNYISKQK